MNETTARVFPVELLAAKVDVLFATFRREFLAEKARLHGISAGRELAFIVGMPRSGSTLVEQILASHAGVRVRGETYAAPESPGPRAEHDPLPWRQGREVERVSFVDALRWLAGVDEELPRLVVNPDRPGRVEPRVVKRRPKKYMWMTRTRADWRKRLMAQAVAG